MNLWAKDYVANFHSISVSVRDYYPLKFLIRTHAVKKQQNATYIIQITILQPTSLFYNAWNLVFLQ